MLNPTTHLQQFIRKNQFASTSLTEVLKQIKNLPKVVSLQKKSILICFLSKYYFLVVQNQLKYLEKFRYECCIAPLMKNQEKKSRNIGLMNRKTKKKYPQIKQNSQLSIEDIAKQVEQITRVEIPFDSELITPKKEPIYKENKDVVTVPAFHPDIIAQMTVQMTNLKNSQIGRSQTEIKSQNGWNPDLFRYQNELALTQKGINLTTERKRANRTEKRTENRKIRIVDDKINLTQGDSKIHELQLLNSKVKISKQRDVENVNYFSNQFVKVDFMLRNVKNYLEKINLKKSQMPFLFMQNSPYIMITSPLNFQDSQMENSEKGSEKNNDFFIIQDNQLSLTKQLQESITKKIDEQLYFKKQASFDRFSLRYGISKQIKGELFYQLMHLGFKLSQSKPQIFGDIEISNGGECF